MITVILKSGDKRLPSNYRPITVIPILYKLFARLLFKRLVGILDPEQSPDQAGFRSGFSTDDHLFTVEHLQEKGYEFQIPIWFAAIDFQKAFDSVEHQAVWNALARQHVPVAYIQLLQKLYSEQSACVRTDVESRRFTITRGTKQGDPLSSLLFNALLEDLMRAVKPEWERKKYGMILGYTKLSQLTNLRFADDVLLIGGAQLQIKKMLGDVRRVAGEVGLLLHPGKKTKILTNSTIGTGRGRAKFAVVGDLEIEIVDLAGSTKYLGRLLTFTDPTETDIEHRIRQAWKAFMSYKDELTNRSYLLTNRLRLFDSVVTPTFLYGSSSWVLTRTMERKARRTQRRMLRMILGAGRRRQVRDEESARSASSYPCSSPSAYVASPASSTPPPSSTHPESVEVLPGFEGDNSDLEPWVDWVRRVTHYMDDQMQKLCLDDWCVAWRRRVWRFAARVSLLPADRWACKAASWDPDDHVRRKGRKPHRPKKRWCDDICEFLRSRGVAATPQNWQEFARDRLSWQQWEAEFCNMY